MTALRMMRRVATSLCLLLRAGSISQAHWCFTPGLVLCLTARLSFVQVSSSSSVYLSASNRNLPSAKEGCQNSHSSRGHRSEEGFDQARPLDVCHPIANVQKPQIGQPRSQPCHFLAQTHPLYGRVRYYCSGRLAQRRRQRRFVRLVEAQRHLCSRCGFLVSPPACLDGGRCS